MSRATRESAATRSLRTRVDTKATGRLVLPGDLVVHLLHGDVLAATAPDDDQQIVRMLHLRGLVDDKRAEELETLAEGGGDVFGEILALGLGVQVDPILRDRFVQNLCDFVVATGTPKWIEQKGVFVANIQMGHVTEALLEEVCRLADLSKAIDPTAQVVRGTVAPGKDPTRRALAEALSDTPRSIEALLAEVPVEPTRGRVVLAEMLLDGVANQHTVADDDDTLMTSGRPVPKSTAPPAAARGTSPSSAPNPSSVPPAPTRTAPVSKSSVPPATPRTVGAEGSGAAKPAPRAEAPPASRSSVPPATPRAEAPPKPTPPVSQSSVPPAPTRTAPPPAPVEVLEEVEPEPLSEDGEVELPEPLQEGGSSGIGAPRSLSDYLAKTAAVGDEDLDFFSDHDHERGGEADGRFRTDTRNLDKVDVGGPAKEDEAIEVDEAPSTRFGAPALTEEEAYAKIEVANEVLQTISAAFDEAEGSGRGRAVVQLLVDGVPAQFAPLLHDLRIDDDGELPARVLLRNLADRPVTEHRQLLNNSLADIIERALSSAADELPDEQIDHVLESVAGYRSRLGL